MKDTIHYFVRDNLNAFSFNMLVILLLDVLSFIVLFVLVLPLPEMFRRGFAGYVNQVSVGYLFFMMFCMYNMLATLFKLVRNVNDYHFTAGELKKVEPRMYYKRIAKNQRDVFLCVAGCIFSMMTLFLALQLKAPAAEPAIEEKKEVEKTAEEKKNDYGCLFNKRDS